MSYETVQASRASGKPVHLYLFEYGEGVVSYHAYTDAEEPIVYDGRTYAPIAIDRDAFNVSGVMDKTALKIMTAYDIALAQLFRNFPPASVGVKIRSGHLGDEAAGLNQFRISWVGRIVSVGFEEETAIYTCEPLFTTMRRNGLRRNYQYGCAHVLYGPKCRAVPQPVNTVPATVDRNNLILAEGTFTAEQLAVYLYGTVTWVDAIGDRRSSTIIRCTGTSTLKLGFPMVGYVPGSQVSLLKGCAHTTEACRLVHANLPNYGGQPYIPVKNPVGRSNQFY